jgi:hypothetical protein
MPFVELNQKKILFIHVPKAGGTTVEQWLSTLAPLRFKTAYIPAVARCTPQHFRMQDFRVLFGPDYFNYAFMLVRNPYSRIASEFRMRATIAGKGFFRSWPSFSLWLEHHLQQAASNPFVLDNHLRPQWEFTGSSVEVFRLEEGMDRILARVADRLGVREPEQIGKEVSTEDFPEPVVWDRIDALRVQEFYARDFTEFGYDPEAGSSS